MCKSLLVFHWKYVCISYRFWDIHRQRWRDSKQEVGVVQGHWKWRRSIDHIRLFIGLPLYLVPFLSYATLKNSDLEIWVRGQWRSFKLVPFESLGAVSYSPSIVTMAVSLTVYEIGLFIVKEKRDLENWVRGCSRSFKMAPFDRPYTTFYWSAIVSIALSGTVFIARQHTDTRYWYSKSVRLSVCLSVCLSVRQSVTFRNQMKTA